MNTESEVGLSVIVPVGRGDSSWQALEAALAGLPADSEVLFSAAEPEPPAFARYTGLLSVAAGWINGPAGRAAQINRGAATAAGKWIWILHADCRPTPQAIEQVNKRIRSDVPDLCYFDLAFAGDGPGLTRINAAGANLRSRLLGLPFGDQGFLIHRAVFERINGFDENLELGEDLDFAVRARAAGYQPRRQRGHVIASARRYREHGWLATTARHAGLTIVLWIQSRRRSRNHST